MIESKHKRYYFYSLFLLELARTLPHAVLTIILINKGLSLKNIAIVQICYMAAIIIFEFPSGIISDIFNRKIVYLTSIFLLMISYFIIFKASSFMLLCISWFIYGMSAAINTGTIDISFTKLYQDNSKKLKAFISFAKMILSISAILGGYIGSILYLYIDIKIYLISLLIYLISSLITIFFIPNDKNTDHRHNKENLTLYLIKFTKKIIILLKSKELLEVFILNSAIQFFYQPFYLYWQAIFIDKNISINIFRIIYVLFRISDIIGAWIFRKIKHSKYDIYIILAIIFLLSVLIELISHIYIFITIIIFLVILISVYSNNLEYFLRKNIDSKVLGTITSINSTLSRIFSFLALGICSILTNFISAINTLVLLILIFCTLSIVVTYKFKNTK
ncbi:MFS transporter (plasmid) [Borreliella garinii]|uniref:MFS transporter n=1 Tax=Borreliella garinii TaxID=29519 RepID=UPI00292D3693|nr:MFS transporter [Borreliella garinii]WNZ67165.1 MFS transporter [Borreliella garinii]WNZ68163.1 MFS transporter [Borreliella garinii]WNZ69163.1 MFS transporter [Borreliella garinii]WNZ71167.1 MFS transporter [Borreliella garinii]